MIGMMERCLLRGDDPLQKPTCEGSILRPLGEHQTGPTTRQVRKIDMLTRNMTESIKVLVNR